MFILFGLIAVITPIKAEPQQQILFSTMVGGQGDDNLTTIATDSDGTVYAGGFTSSQWSQSALQALLVKITPDGTMITKTLGLQGVDKIIDILVPADPRDEHIWIALDSSSGLYTQYTYTVDGTGMSDIKLFRLKKSDLSEVFSITIGDISDDNASMLFERGLDIGILGTSRSFAYPGTVPGTREGLSDPVVTVINYRSSFPEAVGSKYLVSPDHQIITSGIQEGGKLYFVGQNMNARGEFIGYLRGYDIPTFQETQPVTLELGMYPTDIELLDNNLHIVGYKGIIESQNGKYFIFNKALQPIASYGALPAISGITTYNDTLLMSTYEQSSQSSKLDIGFRYWQNGTISPLLYQIGSSDNEYLMDLQPIGGDLVFSGNTVGRDYPVTNGSTYQGHYEGILTRFNLNVLPGPIYKNYLPLLIK
jgi:hypothetical protein